MDSTRTNLKNRILIQKNELQIRVDNINQLEDESEYKEEHRALIYDIEHFNKMYRNLKQEIFLTISIALKDQKQKRLLK